MKSSNWTWHYSVFISHFVGPRNTTTGCSRSCTWKLRFRLSSPASYSCTPSIPKWLSYPVEFFGPKMIVRFISPARNLMLKVKYFRAKLSTSRSLWHRNFWRRYRVVVVLSCKSHTYNCSVNGQQTLILPKLETRTITLGWRKHYEGPCRWRTLWNVTTNTLAPITWFSKFYLVLWILRRNWHTGEKKNSKKINSKNFFCCSKLTDQKSRLFSTGDQNALLALLEISLLTLNNINKIWEGDNDLAKTLWVLTQHTPSVQRKNPF